ncbi:MAG TPA: type II secretion system protein M [Gammaproteobacteria bacterium]
MNALEELRRRFAALEPRERHFLAAGAAVVVIAILFFAVLQPLGRYRERLEDRVAGERELVSWMRGAVDVLRERAPASRQVDTSGSLLALADTSARAAGLAQSLRRIQQDGDDAVRVRLEAASFDALVVWLEDLELRYGATISEMTVDRADGAGLVNVSLTLTRAGA